MWFDWSRLATPGNDPCPWPISQSTNFVGRPCYHPASPQKDPDMRAHSIKPGRLANSRVRNLSAVLPHFVGDGYIAGRGFGSQRMIHMLLTPLTIGPCLVVLSICSAFTEKRASHHARRSPPPEYRYSIPDATLPEAPQKARRSAEGSGTQ